MLHYSWFTHWHNIVSNGHREFPGSTHGHSGWSYETDSPLPDSQPFLVISYNDLQKTDCAEVASVFFTSLTQSGVSVFVGSCSGVLKVRDLVGGGGWVVDSCHTDKNLNKSHRSSVSHYGWGRCSCATLRLIIRYPLPPLHWSSVLVLVCGEPLLFPSTPRRRLSET